MWLRLSLNGGFIPQSQYVHHKEVRAALGVKLVAPDLEKAIAGSRLLVIGPDDDEDDLRDEVMSDLTSLLNSIDKSGRGVCVQASTLGSLEALLDFLKVSKIPVNGINIGPVHKRDIMRCATMLEKAKELAVILAFDVPVDKDADKLAEEMGVRIFKGSLLSNVHPALKLIMTIQLTLFTISSTHSRPTIMRSWRLREGMLLPKRSGRAGSRPLLHSVNVIRSFWVSISWMEPCASAHLSVL